MADPRVQARRSANPGAAARVGIGVTARARLGARRRVLGVFGAALAVLGGVTACQQRARDLRPGGDARDAGASPARSDVSNPPVFTPIARIERVTLASGLVIEEVRHGSGELCVPDATVKVTYTCRVQGADVFDGTGAQPMEYRLAEMIRGWQEGLPGMLVGGVRRLIVPPELGYGDHELKDADGTVLAPANSTLVYEVELVGVR